MRIKFYKELVGVVIFLFLIFSILPLGSQNTKKSAKVALDEFIKELKKEREYYSRLAKILASKEEALRQWQAEIEKKARKLEEERKKLNEEWKKLDEARKAKKVDPRIKSILETLEPQAAIDSIIHYYNTDKKMFYSIGLSILTMKKGVRTSILQGLSTAHKQAFLDLIDFLAKQAGYQEKIKEFKKKGGNKNG